MLTGQKNNNLLPYLVIISGGLLLFLPFLGSVALFDWDEVNFAEIAREMIVTKDYLTVQINYQPFWEKPPLFIWMQVLSMKLFGVNEFAARFPNAVCGLITLLVLFEIGKRLYSQKMGLIWVLVYAGSILPFFYFKSGIIDPWFNLFIFLGIYFAVIYIQAASHKPQAASHKPQAASHKSQAAITKSSNPPIPQSPNLPIFLSGLFIGLAILTKGPVAFLIFGITGFVYLITSLITSKLQNLKSSNPQILKSSNPPIPQSPNPPIPQSPNPPIPSALHILLFLAGLALTGGSWFFIMILNGQMEVVKDFIIYQVRLFSTKDAGHGGFPGYHIVILLLGVFPASAFLFNGFKGNSGETQLQKDWRRIMIILLFTVVILFEIVQTKIVHYSSLAYFPLTFLASLAIFRIIEEKMKFSRLSVFLVIFLAALWIIVIAGFTLAGLNREWLMNSGWIKDPFAVANLDASIRWTGMEILVAAVMAGGTLAFTILKTPARKIIALFASAILFTFLTMAVFTGKIAGYTQDTVNEFYAEKAGEDCYLKTLGYKSYAHMFYGKTLPQENPMANDMNWLLNGAIDKPAYFVFKITRKEEYARIYPHLTILYEKNGFIFAARYPEKPNQGL